MDCASMVEEVLEVALPVPPDADPAVAFVLVSNQASVPGIENVVGVAYGFFRYRAGPTGEGGLPISQLLIGDGAQRFSDRRFTYANNREAEFDPERTDPIGVTITRTPPQLVQVEIELVRWGGHRFHLRDLRCEAGVMLGIGDGVGPKIHEALYVLSFRRVGEL